ncbi:MAG: glycosyltransferase family 4 protein [Actinomycetota bacterium]|nr:glycosyltransferase family 4 protein [Actinomycetota bacterium]
MQPGGSDARETGNDRHARRARGASRPGIRADGVRRVALVAPPYLPVPPTGYGGIERVVALLADGLVARGYEVTVFAAPGSRTTARLVVPLDTAPLLGDPSSVADDLFHTTSAFLSAREFDLVHDHTGLGPPLGAMLEGRVPVVHTLHGPWTRESRRLFGLLDGRVHLVAISEAQRRANPGLRYAGVVYNGIDLDTHPLRVEKEPFLVYVGRVSPEKRPELAIDIARRAGLPLTMIVKRSEPAERAYWDEVVAPRLGSDVDVLDEPPHEVKVGLMGRAQAMLFPIDWPEPFGLVMAEAMACGTPVIARPLGAAPEVIEDGVTGFLRATVQEMADAVAGTTRLSPQDCRARAEQLFSGDAMVDGYVRLYERVERAERAGRAGRGLVAADDRDPAPDDDPGFAPADGRRPFGSVSDLPTAG